jgi:hypothetical protein
MTLIIDNNEVIANNRVRHTIEIPQNDFLGRVFNIIIKYFRKPYTLNGESSAISIGKLQFDNTDSKLIERGENVRHNHASKILEDILNNNSLDIGDIQAVYQNSAANDILNHIAGLARKNKILSSSANTRQKKYNIALRQPQTERSFNLQNAWKNMIISDKYYEINKALVQDKLPQIKSLEYIYGEYARDIYKIFSKAVESRLERYQGLLAVTHYNQVGAMAYFSNSATPDYYLVAVGAMHDILEDLVDLQQIDIAEAYNSVLKSLVPEKFHEDIKSITNHYSLLINWMIKNLGQKTGNFRTETNKYLKKVSESENLSKYAKTLQENISTLKKTDDKPYYKTLEYLKKIFYASYIEDMLSSPQTLYIKERDLFINSQTLDSMNLPSKIKNIRKQMLFWETIQDASDAIKKFPDDFQEFKTNTFQSIITDAYELQANSISLAKEILISQILNQNFTEGLQVVFNMIRPEGQLHNVLYEKNYPKN